LLKPIDPNTLRAFFPKFASFHSPLLNEGEC